VTSRRSTGAGGAGEVNDPVPDRHLVRAWRPRFGRQQRLQVTGDVLVVASQDLQQVPPGHDADDPAAPENRDRLDPALQKEPAGIGDVGLLGQRDDVPCHGLGRDPGCRLGRLGDRGEMGPRVGRQLEWDQVGLGDEADLLAVVHHRHGADAVADQQVGDLFEPHARRHTDHRA
jgi:hypothetical protein